MPFPEPIPNAVADDDGALLIPALQSPDYARTDIPFSIQGWRLSSSPSEINVGSLRAEQLYISSDVPGSANAREINVTQLLGSGPDHSYFAPNNDRNLTTAYTGYSKLTESYCIIDVPPLCVGNDSPAMCHWEVFTSFDIRSLSATFHGVLCTIGVSNSPFGGWDFPFTTNGTVGYLTHNSVNAADTVTTKHIIGSANNTYLSSYPGGKYSINPTATYLNLSPAARTTVAGTAVLHLASTYMHVIRSPLYPRLS